MRAIWYTVEVTASENTHISGGIVQCVWFAGATIWDYDKVYDQMAEYFSNCFPIKVLASHLCCPPKVITRVITPIIHSFMSKEFRARTLTHDVPESDILPVLSAYGIMPDMLPVAMGGTVVLHQAEWIVFSMADPAFSDVATARPNYSFRLSLSESRAAESDERLILCIRRSCTSSFYPQASVIFLQCFASESCSYIYTHFFERSIS